MCGCGYVSTQTLDFAEIEWIGMSINMLNIYIYIHAIVTRADVDVDRAPKNVSTQDPGWCPTGYT